jgi:hypothetical protein
MLAIVMGSVLLVTCIYPAPITAMRIAGALSVPAMSSGSEEQTQVNVSRRQSAVSMSTSTAASARGSKTLLHLQGQAPA